MTPPILISDYAHQRQTRQIKLTFLFCVLTFIVTAASAQPLAGVAIGLVPLIIVVAARSINYPFELCLAFVIFSFFRIHEVFPVLMPLRIPNMLAIGTFAALGWHMFLRKTIKPQWSRELILFLAFFMHVTIGLPFASDRPAAIGYWQGTYSKIAVMVFAIAWLMRTENHFRRLMLSVVVAGSCVGVVAILNKLNGIGLVEGTRVTIGRSFGSALGDPNDLSLVLLFPMAFATALATQNGLVKLDRTIGIIGVPIIMYAVICTQSRGGLLGSLAVFGVIANHYIKQKIIIIGGGGIAGLALMIAAGISKRASGGAVEEGIDESAMGRIHAWNAAWRMAIGRPLTGVGVDNFYQNYFFFSDHWDGVPHAVHSTWFVVIAESGFPGIIMFVALFAFAVKTALSSLTLLEHAPAIPRALALALIAGLAGFGVSGTFLTQGYTWPFYIKLALVVGISTYAKRFRDPVREKQNEKIGTAEDTQ
jgi:putative inorganic carbon (HCO3(-)) transporter